MRTRLRVGPWLLVTAALAACGGGTGDDAADTPPTTAAETATTTTTTTALARKIDIATFFAAPPAGYSYGPTPQEVRDTLAALRESEDGRSISGADARPLLFSGTQIGVQTVYTLDGSGDLDPAGLMAGYLDSTGGGDVTDVTIAGRPVKKITKDPASSSVPFSYAYLSDTAVVFVSATTDAHASTVAGAVVGTL